MTRVRLADDFKAIRLRVEELRREPAQLYADGPYTATFGGPRPRR